MKTTSRASLANVYMVSLLASIPVSRAQDPGTGGLLGGFGAMAGAASSSMGSGFNIANPGGSAGGIIVPSGGRGNTVLPMSMSGGGAMRFEPRGSSIFAAARPNFSLDSMRGGMGSMASGMQSPMRRRPFALTGSGLLGPGPTGGMPASMGGAAGMGVMPPSFGYPFYRPPSLFAPASAGAGMSM